jgi:acetylglutamate kinase
MNLIEKSEVLSNALPYIQQYRDKIIVVKYGGNAMINDDLKQKVMSDIVLLSTIGFKIVLVHGGGPEINTMLSKIGKESRFINGLRVTDGETMDIVQMVLCGKVNKDLVSLLHKHNGKGIGLCGLDDHMIKAKPISEELGYVGNVIKINAKPIINVLNNGYIPVIATVAVDEKDGHDYQVYNINADTAASEIAIELKASNFILMTDIAGLLRDKNDENTLINEVRIDEIKELKERGIIDGGMIPKAECCYNAVRNGVGQADIIDGRVPHSILIELLTKEGAGTMFYKKR